MSVAENIAIVRSYIGAVENLDVERVRALLDPDIVQTEYPNRLYPQGQVRGADRMMTDLPRASSVLRSQTYTVSSMFGDGDVVAVEARWEGVVNVPLGRLQPGETMVAHIAMVFRLRDGLIVSQNNYDCYEDFSAAS